MSILMEKKLDAIYPIHSLVDKKQNSFQLKFVSTYLFLHKNSPPFPTFFPHGFYLV